jgi:hypothetical protein
MAYNILSGTVIAAQTYGPGGIVQNAIVSGNLSTSDGSSIVNVPRVTSPVNNGLITNVNGNANTLTCESNLKFDGSALSVTGEITASIGVSASYFRGDGRYLTGITASSGGGSLTVNGIGDAAGTLIVGFNYGSAAFTSTRIWTTPTSPTVGDVVRVKAPAGVSSTNILTIEGYADHTIDGLTSVPVISPYGAVALCYVVSGSYRIF